MRRSITPHKPVKSGSRAAISCRSVRRSVRCSASRSYSAEGKKFNAVYLVDHQLGFKVFADAAFYSLGGQDPKKPDVVPFMLKKDAEDYAAKNGGKLATYTEVLAPSMSDNRSGRWARHPVRKS